MPSPSAATPRPAAVHAVGPRQASDDPCAASVGSDSTCCGVAVVFVGGGTGAGFGGSGLGFVGGLSGATGGMTGGGGGGATAGALACSISLIHCSTSDRSFEFGRSAR